MSFTPFGPVNISENAVLNGWSVELKPSVTAVYGALAAKRPVQQLFTEPVSGLAIYAPDSGLTLAKATGFPDRLRIRPGRCYFYSADVGSYLGELPEPGVYSGLKVFLGADAASAVGTQTARRYCRAPQTPIFSEIALGGDCLSRIAELPSALPDQLADELHLMASLNRIVADILSIWVKTEACGNETGAGGIGAQIEAADRYLKAHLAAPPSVLSLANLVGLNHMTMKRGFRRIFGTTVYGRLRHWRALRAAALLEAGASVTDTALEVGYANPSKFAAAFKRETGRNPSDLERFRD